MGRLWQTLILARWNEVFAWIPMESLVYEKRPQYYDALQNAQSLNDSGEFIEFTLSAILDAVEAQTRHQDKHQDKHQVELNEVMLSVLRSLEAVSLSRKEIFAALNMSGDTRAFRRSIKPLLSDGYVEMTVPDEPNSKLQKYRLTDKGKAVIR
jgi:Fic family protein